MSLFIGTTLICLSALWLIFLLLGGRNPNPPWWANDWMLADIQVPSMMTLAIFGIWFMTRFTYHQAFRGGMLEVFSALGVVAATALIIRKINVGRRLKQFEEMEADKKTEESESAEPAQMTTIHRKLPWQVRLYLADNLGYDLAWIRGLRCIVREIAGQPSQMRFLAFNPDQAKTRGVDITGYDMLDGHPELVVCGGIFTMQGDQVTVDSAIPRQAA